MKKQDVEEKLMKVLDPELHISIFDLGLIYQVSVKKNTVEIVMTLTTLGCPLFDTIQEDIYEKVEELGVSRNQISIELTFDPPWSLDRMTERGKAMLGI